MADYAKLTVVKLKEVLKERGLQVSGNKAALVARLEENDAEAQEAPAEESAAEEQAEVAEAEAEDGPSEGQALEEVNDTAPSEESQDVEEAQIQAKVASGIEPQALSKDPVEESPVKETAEATDTLSGIPPAPEPSMVEPITEKQAHTEASEAAPMEVDVAVDDAMQEQEETDTRPLQPLEDEPIPPATGVADEVQEIQSESQQLGEPLSQSLAPTQQATGTQVSVQHVNLPHGTQESSVDRDEVFEDTRKRKRRSHSPAPDSLEVAAKKAKAIDGSPRVTTIKSVDAVGTQEPQSDQMDFEKSENPVASVQDKLKGNEGESRTPPRDEPKDNLLSPSRQNAKFKGLFAATAPSQPTKAEIEQYPVEDREVEPALHPATTALYIRNLMRPVQPSALREHLEGLAKPSSEFDNEEAITQFYLDGIRTHCFAQFRSISAASRVRLALHDRIWPDERTRKALWVDYIPEEKVESWIEVEQESIRQRDGPPKRFEVAYEKEGDDVVAHLQEGDGTGARPSVSAASGLKNGTVPAGPRTIPPPTAQGDTGKGFKQLDDLFKSTAAKPKLYYQPVSESIVEKRLGLLARGRGGGRSEETRRFTFEDALIVDKGPEFGSGWRGGGRGGRGGYGRGYSSRGGYRGDSWRDSYR